MRSSSLLARCHFLCRVCTFPAICSQIRRLQHVFLPSSIPLSGLRADGQRRSTRKSCARCIHCGIRYPAVNLERDPGVEPWTVRTKLDRVRKNGDVGARLGSHEGTYPPTSLLLG